MLLHCSTRRTQQRCSSSPACRSPASAIWGTQRDALGATASNIESPSPLPSSSIFAKNEGKARSDAIACFPTAATLVITDGSAHVSLAFCATTVHAVVQHRLRSLLVERCVAPLLPTVISDEDDLGEAERLALATAAVQAALRRTRHVAFFASSPLLQHRSWSPLCAAYGRHLQRQQREHSGGIASCSGNDEPHADDGDVVAGQEGLEGPLFGTAPRGTFFYVPGPPPGGFAAASASAAAVDEASGALGAVAGQRSSLLAQQGEVDNAGTEAAAPALSSDSAATNVEGISVAAGLHWECFRVDAYMPAFVQLQAAVRHLLRARRPARSCWELDDSPNADTRTHGDAAGRLAVRSLAVIALVVPDHHVDIFQAFLSELERERATTAAAAGAADNNEPVQLLLFNSSGLVCVSDAV